MNQEELFDKIKDLIKKMANDYYKYTKELGIEFDDLYQEGCQAFLDNIKNMIRIVLLLQLSFILI